MVVYINWAARVDDSSPGMQQLCRVPLWQSWFLDSAQGRFAHSQTAEQTTEAEHSELQREQRLAKARSKAAGFSVSYFAQFIGSNIWPAYPVDDALIRPTIFPKSQRPSPWVAKAKPNP